MVGINYSKRTRFPNRTRGKISDEEDQLGLNRDRLSTFSFSDNRPAAARRSRPPIPGEEGDGADAGEEGDGADPPAVAGRDRRGDDRSFGVDNFHNNVNIDRSATKLGSLAGRAEPAAASDRQTNHADRLSTFSLSSADGREDGGEDPPPDGAAPGDAGAAPPPRGASDHMERLGTFSFAAAGAGDPSARPPGPAAGGRRDGR